MIILGCKIGAKMSLDLCRRVLCGEKCDTQKGEGSVMPQLSLYSRKLRKTFHFYTPTKNLEYVYVDFDEGDRPGTSGMQICHGGGFRGETILACGPTFEARCRTWLKAHVAKSPAHDMSTKENMYYISNIAGGDMKWFSWKGKLSGQAIAHADRMTMGAHFGGDKGAEASDYYVQVLEDRNEREV